MISKYTSFLILLYFSKRDERIEKKVYFRSKEKWLLIEFLKNDKLKCDSKNINNVIFVNGKLFEL